MLRRLRQRAPFAAMGLLSLVLAHNLVFVVGYGAAYREALSRTGHGGAWTTAVVVVLALGLGLLLAATVRIAVLTRQARALGSVPVGLGARPAFLPGLVSLWVRLALTETALYIVQENIEHLRAGADLPGIAVLVPGGRPDTLVIVAAGRLLRPSPPGCRPAPVLDPWAEAGGPGTAARLGTHWLDRLVPAGLPERAYPVHQGGHP